MRLFHRDTVVVQLALPLLEPEPDAAVADSVTLQLADPMLTLTVPVIVIVTLGVRSDSVAVSVGVGVLTWVMVTRTIRAAAPLCPMYSRPLLSTAIDIGVLSRHAEPNPSSRPQDRRDRAGR